MTRQEAIAALLALPSRVAWSFGGTGDEVDDHEASAREALRALGVADKEINAA